MKRIASIVFASIFPATLSATEVPLGWPEVIAHLTEQRTEAETCVGMLKSSKNNASIAFAKAIYEATKPRVDGVVAGLVAALVEGGKPDALPTVRDDLDASGPCPRFPRRSHQKWRYSIVEL